VQLAAVIPGLTVLLTYLSVVCIFAF